MLRMQKLSKGNYTVYLAECSATIGRSEVVLRGSLKIMIGGGVGGLNVLRFSSIWGEDECVSKNKK